MGEKNADVKQNDPVMKELLQHILRERREVDFALGGRIALACSPTITGKTRSLGTDAGRWSNILVGT